MRRPLGFADFAQALASLQHDWNVTVGPWPTWIEGTPNPDPNPNPHRVWTGEVCIFVAESQSEVEAFVVGLAAAVRMTEKTRSDRSV